MKVNNKDTRTMSLRSGFIIKVVLMSLLVTRKSFTHYSSVSIILDVHNFRFDLASTKLLALALFCPYTPESCHLIRLLAVRILLIQFIISCFGYFGSLIFKQYQSLNQTLVSSSCFKQTCLHFLENIIITVVILKCLCYRRYNFFKIQWLRWLAWLI